MTMDTDRFERALKLLSTAPSRRQALGGVVGVLVGGVLGSASPISARGRKGKGGKGKKKTRRGGQVLPPASSPPRPVAMADASCSITSNAIRLSSTNFPRVAQTFRALRTGQLTSASVVLLKNDEGSDLDVEIWSVTQENVPDALLAGTTIANLPATIDPDIRTATATFPTPASVVAGRRYALVITFAGGESALLSGPGNPCADGNIFTKSSLNAAWSQFPDNDMGFETVVTA
jgi:hypothetical protein